MKSFKFKVTKVEVGSWTTSFSIKNLGHANEENSMSATAFFHHLGGLCGKELSEIKGLEFEIILPVDETLKKSFDPLDLCGKTIKV